MRRLRPKALGPLLAAAALCLGGAAVAGCGGARLDGTVVTAAGAEAPPAEPAEPIDLELPTLEGGTYRLSDDRGHVVVLHFFASFDAPSQAVAPVLEQVHIEAADRGIRVVAVAMDPEVGRVGRREVLESYCAANNLTFTVLFATPELTAGETDVGRIPEIPATVIIDPDGRPVASFTGPFLGSELTELLDRVVAATPPR